MHRAGRRTTGTSGKWTAASNTSFINPTAEVVKHKFWNPVTPTCAREAAAWKQIKRQTTNGND
jgi:hypothetical protein